MLTLIRQLARLPLRLLHAIGGALGWASFLASPGYRQHFHDHVQRAGMNAKAARPAIAHTGRMVGELPFLWLRPPRATEAGATSRTDGKGSSQAV